MSTQSSNPQAKPELTQSTREFNVLFVHSTLDDYGLSPQEFRLYCHLARRASSGDGAWPSVDTMAAACKMGHRTVRYCLAILCHNRLLEKRQRPGMTALYHLTPASAWREKISRPDYIPHPKRHDLMTPTLRAPSPSGTTTPPLRALPPLPFGHPEGYPIKDIPRRGTPSSPPGGDRTDLPSLWNESGLPKVDALTLGQARALKRRLRDPVWVQKAPEAIRRAASSAFVRKTGRGFSWFLKETTVPQLLDGFFDDRPNEANPAAAVEALDKQRREFERRAKELDERWDSGDHDAALAQAKRDNAQQLKEVRRQIRNAKLGSVASSGKRVVPVAPAHPAARQPSDLQHSGVNELVKGITRQFTADNGARANGRHKPVAKSAGPNRRTAA